MFISAASIAKQCDVKVRNGTDTTEGKNLYISNMIVICMLSRMIIDNRESVKPHLYKM